MKTTILYMMMAVSPLCLSNADSSRIWVGVEQGTVLYFNPYTSAWVPIIHKEEISRSVYILIKERSIVKMFDGTESFLAPSNAYFFIEDIEKKSKNDLVGKLVQIEAEHLPIEYGKERPDKSSPVGLTYGQQPQKKTNGSGIPYYTERMNAVQWFLKEKRYDAALLSIKRLVMKFPILYTNPSTLEMLFSLYDKHSLYGFIFDETNRLLALSSHADNEMIRKWHSISKTKLTHGK